LDLIPNFVPVADEVHRLQTGTDTECRHFQKMANQGHYGGRPGTRQGTYVAAPSGVMLASMNSNDPTQIAAMLQRALAKWATLSLEQRQLPEKPESQAAEVRRLERLYPEKGLILRVNTRDLPREKQPADWRAKAWNQDFAWFRKEEARQFLPEKPAVGTRQELPAALAQRIARCSLVDNVRGQTQPYQAEQVEKAQLTTEVLAVTGDVVLLRLEGETRTAAEGVWPVNDRWDALQPKAQTRGFETRLLGTGKFDLKQERFVAFEMVALGSRWGGTQYNRRADDLEPGPIGVAFTLAGATPAEHVAPAFLRAYGWE
jgi:hypothetical protein